jgi:hypothetical protein
MDMGGQYHQVDADFRRKHADLLQTREHASDTVVQGFLASDEVEPPRIS